MATASLPVASPSGATLSLRDLVGWLKRHRRLKCQMSATTDELVFTARRGSVVGPVPAPDGFALILVEALGPAEMDETTVAVARQELLTAWLREQIGNARIHLKDLEVVDAAR